MIRPKHSGRAILAACELLVVCAGLAVTQMEPPGDRHPQSEYAGKFDWVQMR